MKMTLLCLAAILAVLIFVPTIYLIATGRVEVRWLVVGLRMWEGFLYGTGFMLALVIWYALITTLPDKPKADAPPAPTKSEMKI